MTRIARFALAALALSASAAQAQQFGLYVGTTSQGETFELRVDDDGFGNPLLASATVFWSATCTKSGPGRFTAWGIGASEPIIARKVALEARFNQLNELVGFGCFFVFQKINPDSRIHQHSHETLPFLISCKSPSHSTLPRNLSKSS